MCSNRIREQYRIAVNENDDALLSIFIITDNLSSIDDS